MQYQLLLELVLVLNSPTGREYGGSKSSSNWNFASKKKIFFWWQKLFLDTRSSGETWKKGRRSNINRRHSNCFCWNSSITYYEHSTVYLKHKKKVKVQIVGRRTEAERVEGTNYITDVTISKTWDIIKAKQKHESQTKNTKTENDLLEGKLELVKKVSGDNDQRQREHIRSEVKIVNKK